MNDEIKYVEEEISIAEFAERFLGICYFTPPTDYEEESIVVDTEDLDIEIFGKNLETGKDEFNKINKFIIKTPVGEYYTDGNLKGTNKHRIIENGETIYLENHVDFHKEVGEMKVVDFEVDKTHNYYANGRLNHNTEPCGKATSFHSSVKIRFEVIEKLKDSEKEIIGVKTRATVRKNRLGPPFKKAEFDVYFDSGVADYASWIDLGKKKSIITGPSNSLSYNGEKFNTPSFVKRLNEDNQFKDVLYNKICDAVIMQYKTPNSVIREDLVTEPEGEETNNVIEEE